MATQPCFMNQESNSASKDKVVVFIVALLGADMAHRVPVLYVNVLLAMPKVPAHSMCSIDIYGGMQIQAQGSLCSLPSL